MAIAANFRKYPEAMALQLVLFFGKPRWHTPRPTTRFGRAVRAFISRRVREIGPVVYPEKRPAPSWLSEARKRATRLAKQVKAGCMALDFRPNITMAELVKANGYRRMILKSRIESGELILAA